MSQVIDHKVVEMRFDNKQFEAGAKQSLSTLEKLKAALKLPDHSKVFDEMGEAAKKMDLSSIAKNLETLTKKFNVFGVAAKRVIENVTDALMSKLNSAVSYVTDSIVSGGIKRATNIENAHFQLQALLKDETKVQAVMDDAMKSVDGTAYAYDEAAKAASQFAASGLEAGDEMLSALKGITGVAAMTNSEYESISNIFTTVAGNGRLMGDQLLQLSSRGLNAASTLANYFQEVQGQADITEADVREMVSSGEISFNTFAEAMNWAFGESAERANETFTGAMSNMKSALARIGAEFVSPLIEQNGSLVNLFNALRIKINAVKSELTFDEQKSAISGLAVQTSLTTEELENLFDTIDKNGKVSTNELNLLNKSGASATKALKKYINGVTNGSIRASYSIKTALGELTQGTKVSTEQVKSFVNEGKVDLATFTAAMETEYGNLLPLSKRFTDFAQDLIDQVIELVNSLDIETIMDNMYYGFRSVINIMEVFVDALKPVGKAIYEALSVFDSSSIRKFGISIEWITSQFKLSEEAAQDLHDATKGIIDVVMLLAEGFIRLVAAVVPVVSPVISLAGAIGRLLSWMVSLIRQCGLLKKGFGLVQTALSTIMGWFKKTIKGVSDFVTAFANLEGVQKLIEAIGNAFKRLAEFTEPYINAFKKNVQNLFKAVFSPKRFNYDNLFSGISDSFSNLADFINGFSLDVVSDALERFQDKIEELKDKAMSNDSFATFVTNLKQFFSDLDEAFTLDNLLNNVDKVMQVFGKFFNWMKDTVLPTFSEISAGEVVAGAGGIGLVAALLKFSNAFEKIAGVLAKFKAIPDTLSAVKNTLVSYQNNLKAEAIQKVAIAIAILAGSLVLLSFADQDNLMSSAVALSMVAGVLLLGSAALGAAIGKVKSTTEGVEGAGLGLAQALKRISKGLKSAIKDFGRAIVIKAIGSMIKDFALSIAIIAGSIIALGWMYREDPEALMAGVELVKQIGIAVGIIMGVMVVVGQLMSKGAKAFAASASGILMLSLSLTIAIAALNKLFKMDFPDDWEFKLKVLGGIFAYLAILAVAIGIASRIAGDNKLGSTGTILALTVMLIATVSSLEKLFKMEFPDDWVKRLAILGGIFAAMGALMITIGISSKLSGGSMKAAGTILSIALFLVVVVGALSFLAAMPSDKILKGAVALGVILVALGVSLAGAGKITDAKTAKSITAMAVVIGVVTAALAILAMIPVEKLAKSTAALGVMLIALAVDFKQVGKIANNKGALIGLVGMIAILAEISAALYILAQQPWQSLIAAGGALSAVLISLGVCFQLILGKNWGANNVKKIGTFLLMTTALIPVVAAIAVLAHQPVAGMLAGALALSGVMLAMGVCFQMVLSKNWSKNNVAKIGTFLLMTLSVIPIAVALAVLAHQPWDGLLAGGIALSAVLGVMTGIFVLISKCKPDVASIIAFGAAMTVLSAAVAYELFKLADKPWQNLLGAAGAISLVLVAMTGCLAILSKVHANVSTGTSAALALGSFIGILGGVMVALGYLFTEIQGMDAYLDKGIEILIKIGEGLGGFIGGIVSGAMVEISNALPAIGLNLSKFYINATPFLIGMQMLDQKVFDNIGSLALALIGLTVADLINGIADFFGCDLSEFGLELTKFWVKALPFFLGINSLKPGSVEAAESVAKMILAFTAADLISGIGNLLGIKTGTLEDFGAQLESFGPYLSQFAEDTKDVSPESVKSAAAAAEIMAELANKLPGTDGLKQKIFGNKSLADFGEQLKEFGPDIAEFADDVKDVSDESVKGAAAAGELMAELADKIPNSGGWLADMVGDNTLAIFGQDLNTFGSFLSGFSIQAGEVNLYNVKKVGYVTDDLITIANKLTDEDGGFWIFSKHKTTIADFGESLYSFIISLRDASKEITSDDIEQLNKISDIVNVITDIADSDIIAQLSESIDNVVETFTTGLANKTSDFTDGADELADAIIKAIGDRDSDFINAGFTTSSKYMEGFNKIKLTIKTSIAVFTQLILTTLENRVADFEDAGYNAGRGYLRGLNDTRIIRSASETAGKLGSVVIESTRAALDENSPSKEMGKVGRFAGLGFVQELAKFVAIAYEKGSEIGDAVTSGINIVFDDLNTDPVLRPVVDLSNVRSSTNEIRSMFNSAISAQNTAALSIASSTSNRTKSDADDIVSAIKHLQDDTTKAGDTYTINGLSYSENEDVSNAFKTIIRYANIKRRV